jgi:hypothetical protein
MKACHACKKELALGREIGRRDECPHCHADLHCCMNCRFFDRSAPKQCREPIAELVREKDKANFCDLFAFADTPTRGLPASDRHDTARKALDDLFKK